ncbi:MAG TPA: flagellar motor switch protein FliN [Armatimonadota bacterium]|jgi:flagellar motor switch protein FliN/FliY
MADETNPTEEPMAPTAAPDAEAEHTPQVQPVQFAPMAPSARATDHNALDLILDVQLEATVELGRSKVLIRDVLALGPGSVVELDKLAGEPADLLINGRPLARGEVVVIDENFGIRITEILSPAERINTLR